LWLVRFLLSFGFLRWATAQSCLVRFIVSCLLRCAPVLLRLLYCFDVFNRLLCFIIYPHGPYPFGSLLCSLNFKWSDASFVCTLFCGGVEECAKSAIVFLHNVLLSSGSLRRSARVGGGGMVQPATRAVSSPYRRTESLFYFQAEVSSTCPHLGGVIERTVVPRNIGHCRPQVEGFSVEFLKSHVATSTTLIQPRFPGMGLSSSGHCFDCLHVKACCSLVSLVDLSAPVFIQDSPSVLGIWAL
jgi:hypothetical protein